MFEAKKICLQCHREFEGDDTVCRYDGSPLQDKPAENACVTCEEKYRADYQYCPIHGEELVASNTPSEEDLHVLDEKSADAFLRGICPNCGAWENWGKSEDEYTCKSCLESFFYSEDKLVSKAGTSRYLEEKKLKESHPYYPVLLEIDRGNCGYWFDRFQKFDENITHKFWNWPSFFLGINRYLWKGMWKKGLLFFAFIFGISFLDGLLGTFPILYILAFLGIRIYMGLAGSIDYYKFIIKLDGNIKKAKSSLLIGRVILVILFILNHVLLILNQIQPKGPPV